MTLIEVTADAADPAAMTALFDRFGADLPALEGIYLAAYAGTPVTLAEMSDADVSAMFRPKIDAATLLHTLSLRSPDTPLRDVLLDLGTTRVTLDRPLHRHQHLSRRPGPHPPKPRITSHRHQLGTMGIADRNPNPRPPSNHTNRPGRDARPASHRDAASRR